MHDHKYQLIPGHIRKVFFQPCKSPFINISDVLVVTIDIEAIVEYNVMGFSFIKRIIDRAEITFKSTVRVLKSTSSVGHVMVADSTINGKVQSEYDINVRWIQRRGITHDVSTINTEYVSFSRIRLYIFFYILQESAIGFHIVFGSDLHISLHQKQMIHIILRILHQLKIISVLFIHLYLLIE